MKDYKQSSAQNSHYSCPSLYGKLVREQYNMQPKVGTGGKIGTGKLDNGMQGAKRNTQKGA